MSARSVVVAGLRRRDGLHDAMAAAYSILHRGRRRMSGRGNELRLSGGSWLNRLRISVTGNDNVIEVGRNCRVIHSSIRILGSNNTVVIGDGVFLERGELVLEDDGNTLRIGRGATHCRNFHLAATEGTKLTVGQEALFSSDVQVRTGDSHAIFDRHGRINPAADTSIGAHVWIGNGAKVLKGATVSAESIVATGAIVTGEFDIEGSILAGTPATCVRTGVRWEGDRHAEAPGKTT